MDARDKWVQLLRQEGQTQNYCALGALYASTLPTENTRTRTLKSVLQGLSYRFSAAWRAFKNPDSE